jgi:hypothetical protein
VQFDTTATVTPAAGRLYFNDGEGGLSYMLKGGNVVQEVGQSQQVLVYNGTGATLNKGQVVYSNGAQGQRPTVALALATSDATSARTLGIVAESIANGAEGFVTTLGIIENIDTSAFTAGAQLYLSGSTAGALTQTKTVAPIHMVYVARCIKSHASSGRMFVTVQNGYELDELHDVSAVSPANNDGIFYNTSTSLWEKKSIVTALGYTPYNATNPAGYTTNTGTVTGVTGTAPIVSSGGTAPAISISAATTSAAGSMSSADKTKLDGIAASANNYVLPKATATALGGVEVFDATVQTVAANAVTSTASRTYGVQLNAADQMVVNVPWTDANSGGTVTSVSGTGTVSGLTLTGSVTTSGSLTLGGTLSLTSGNVTTALGYTPPQPTGTGASGSWGISITGNAATVTNGLYTSGDQNTITGTKRFYSPNNTQINTVSAGDRGLSVFQETGSADAYMTFHVSTDYAAYFGLGGAENDLVYGGWSAGANRHRILHSGNYTSWSPSLTGSGASGSWGISITGNAATATASTTATNLSTNRTNWSTNGTITAVVGQLAWKNYSNNHTIFDASAGTSPGGSAVNNTNAEIAWAGSYPTLMGWNGNNTYGVRVDSARVADSASAVTGTVAAANGGTGLTSPGTAGNVLTSNGSAWVSSAPAGGSVAYPQNIQSGNYTLVLADAGKHIYSANTGAQTITIPTNASVPFGIGAVITFVNMGSAVITLGVSGLQVYSNNGSRAANTAPSVAVGETVQLVKTATNSWNTIFGKLLSPPASFLSVAGGGGGGSTGGGGGGAGGFVTGTFIPSGTMVVTVGAGGAATAGFQEGFSGSPSHITGTTVAVGGGAGAYSTGVHSGGSGGGGHENSPVGGAGTAGQGNAGGSSSETYVGGGGGGAGSAGGAASGLTGGIGGVGLASSITGTSVMYAGGGGGGTNYTGYGNAAGGAGGGGAGGSQPIAGIAGTANTGGGGGGGGGSGVSWAAPAGGSGIVIISSPTAALSTTGSPTITTSGGNTIYQFNSSGTITFA